MPTYSAVHVSPTGEIADVLQLVDVSMTLGEAESYLSHHLALNPTHVQPGEYRMLTAPDYKRLVWSRDWRTLSQNERDLYTILWPSLGSPERDPATSKTIAQLKAVAHHRMHKLGLSETCSRCSGSGHYSSNQRFGTTCFKCGGKAHVPGCGYQMPRITAKLINQTRERMAKAILSDKGEIISVGEWR